MTTLLWTGFALGCAFGAAARTGRFCLLRGLRQTQSLDSSEPHGAPALQAFALALAVALIATQALAFSGQIDLNTAQVVRSQFSWFAVLFGGLLFGIGMTLARSCAARALVLVAGGNLRSLVTLICLALAAQATLTGALAPLRIWVQKFGVVTLSHATWNGQLIAAGWSRPVVLLLTTALPAIALIIYAMWHPALRRSTAQWLCAIVIGALVAAGWWITGNVGIDEFEPVPLTSLSFVGPLAQGLLYLQLAVGRSAGIGAAIVAGTFAGALVAALVSRSAHWEVFDSPARFGATIIGGLLMGFGGVLAVGCSIGQGLSGLSTLAFASVPAIAGIVIGALITLRLQHRTQTSQGGLPT